jgi:SAM-dependent methyltransferase
MLPSRLEQALKRLYLGTAAGTRRLIYALWPRDFDQRWRSVEEPKSLTWGTILEGRSFFYEAQKAADIVNAGRILEIGPGYGRLLQARHELGGPPELYVGVDLSRGRVEELSRWFGNRHTRFIEGDARTVDLSLTAPFDLVISSATFEHIYPDFICALQHLRLYFAENAKVVFDLPDTGHNWSEINTDPSGVFMRVYTAREIATMMAKAEFRLLKLSKFNMASTQLKRNANGLRRTGGVSLSNGNVALVHRIMVVAQSV